MRDQLDRLPAGLPGAMLWGGQTRSEAELVMQEAASGAIKLLYVAPEKLLTPVVLQALLRLPQGISLVSRIRSLQSLVTLLRPTTLAHTLTSHTRPTHIPLLTGVCG